MTESQSIIYQADIEILEPTDELKREAAAVVDFPEDKTPDLLFFHGIMLSTGTNKNGAHFLGSELVKAHKSIKNKALDIEHEEDQVVGHIYSYKFVSHGGKILDLPELESMASPDLDAMNIDVHIGGILYKSRFPKLSEEVANGKWCLSMETYFQDYDIKIGNVIMTKQEAEALGISVEDALGKAAKLLRGGVEVAAGDIARVLRGLLFSGCGVVKNPAESRAIILETAKQKGVDVSSGDVTVEIEGEIPVIADAVEIVEEVTEEVADLDSFDSRKQNSIGLCVSYKKNHYDTDPPGPQSELLSMHWCALYETNCTSASRDAHDPKCLRNQVRYTASEHVERVFVEINGKEKLNRLQDLLEKVNIK